MNFAAILSLISDLYTANQTLTSENQQLRDLLEQATKQNPQEETQQ
jgi:hypothetical protein